MTTALADMDIRELHVRNELCKQIMREAIEDDDERWWDLLPQQENLQAAFNAAWPAHVAAVRKEQAEREATEAAAQVEEPKPEPVRVQMGTARAGVRARA